MGCMHPAERATDPSTGAGSPFRSLSLEHSSTVDRVAEELRRAVFDGELESGTPLREVALAESLAVSRSTVREALGVLVDNATRHGRGTVTLTARRLDEPPGCVEVGDHGDGVGVNRFGASAPGGEMLKHYGFTVENVIAQAKALLS